MYPISVPAWCLAAPFHSRLRIARILKHTDEQSIKGGRVLVITSNIVPGSDGAGTVLSTGKSVTSFASGDKVVTHLVPHALPNAFPTGVDISSGLGHAVDGTIREYGVFDESALIRMPENLSFEQAATLTCSGLTAWNALFGGGRGLRKGDTILTQGTGGVSMAALQVNLTSLYLLRSCSS
jgi:NADPH:quinone reductase-like Zn-dependent oxidoreductase